mmetsp:Transcript_5336/g.11303  ORF Transcript_5336/g.11303 Transcript_5336/m.11303 type:complete len:227 (+) Transcript_5336:429-1109(+)
MGGPSFWAINLYRFCNTPKSPSSTKLPPKHPALICFVNWMRIFQSRFLSSAKMSPIQYCSWHTSLKRRCRPMPDIPPVPLGCFAMRRVFVWMLCIVLLLRNFWTKLNPYYPTMMDPFSVDKSYPLPTLFGLHFSSDIPCNYPACMTNWFLVMPICGLVCISGIKPWILFPHMPVVSEETDRHGEEFFLLILGGQKPIYGIHEIPWDPKANCSYRNKNAAPYLVLRK